MDSLKERIDKVIKELQRTSLRISANSSIVNQVNDLLKEIPFVFDKVIPNIESPSRRGILSDNLNDLIEEVVSFSKSNDKKK